MAIFLVGNARPIVNDDRVFYYHFSATTQSKADDGNCATYNYVSNGSSCTANDKLRFMGIAYRGRPKFTTLTCRIDYVNIAGAEEENTLTLVALDGTGTVEEVATSAAFEIGTAESKTGGGADPYTVNEGQLFTHNFDARPDLANGLISLRTNFGDPVNSTGNYNMQCVLKVEE